jgi:hypothetical protein
LTNALLELHTPATTGDPNGSKVSKHDKKTPNLYTKTPNIDTKNLKCGYFVMVESSKK